MQALKGIVIILGLTIVLAVGVLVWGLYKKSEDPGFKMFSFTASDPAGKAPPAAGAPAPAGVILSWGTVSLNLPTGCAVKDMTVQPGMLFVRSGAAGDAPIAGCGRVTVLDPATGRVLGTVMGGP